MDAVHDQLTKAELEALAGHRAAACVSIHFSPHRVGREVQQDAIRLRNLLERAAERLRRLGLRRLDVDDILDPARALLDDPLFWEHRALGVALFASLGWLARYRLPIELAESVVVGPRFDLKPLFALTAGGERSEHEARTRFEELVGRQGAGRTALRALDRVSDVVSAAGAGRIDSLLIALDAQAWGRVDEAGLTAETHSRREPGDEDLLNRAALETYLKGGAVFAVPSERVPGRTPAAAILRF